MEDEDKALEGLRVIEFPDALTSYCGKLLADMGADVIMIEPLDGSGLRSRAPLLDGIDNESSVPFLYWGTNKRSVALDLSNPAGVAALVQMVAEVDVVVEGFRPGALDELGLGWPVLQAANPDLVLTSVTPFGASGPYATYQASDLVALAMGGLLYMGGSPQEPPQQPSAELAYVTANIFAAVGTLMAVLVKERGGPGQQVDVSMQESVCMALENAIQYYDQESHIRRRWAGTQRTAGQGIFPCRDGYVFLLAGGIAANRFWDPFVAWMNDEAVEDADVLRLPEWRTREYVESDAGRDQFDRIFTSFAASRTKESLYVTAQSRGIPLCPVNDLAEVWQDLQLLKREYFVEIDDHERGLVLSMPGAPYVLSETPAVAGRAPLLGADTSSVLTELGVSDAQQRLLIGEGAIR